MFNFVEFIVDSQKAVSENVKENVKGVMDVEKVLK